MKRAVHILSDAVAPLWRRLPPLAQLALASLRAPPHWVSVAAVIRDEHDRVLLVEHRLRTPALSVPGGFVARGEQPEQALRREVREEVGIELTRVTVAFVQALVDTPQMEIVYSCRAGGAPAADGLEALSARWVPLADLPRDLHEDERARILRAVHPDPRPAPRREAPAA
jgi:ADP-ribose pyrophosphatase YjhB (NUDIX family)